MSTGKPSKFVTEPARRYFHGLNFRHATTQFNKKSIPLVVLNDNQAFVARFGFAVNCIPSSIQVQLSPLFIRSSIQLTKELTRAKTEYVSPAGHPGIPQLTAPRRTNFPPSLQTSGPPLSPLHPVAVLLPPKPAQSMDSLSMALKNEFPFEHVDWFTVGSWTSCSFEALSPPLLFTPQPIKWEELQITSCNYIWVERITNLTDLQVTKPTKLWSLLIFRRPLRITHPDEHDKDAWIRQAPLMSAIASQSIVGKREDYLLYLLWIWWYLQGSTLDPQRPCGFVPADTRVQLP